MARLHELFGVIGTHNGMKSINFAEIEEEEKKLAIQQKRLIEKQKQR